MTLHIYETQVSENWIDYNQHMNAGYYNVVFDSAIEAILDEFGGRAYMARTGGTFYSVETHIVYAHELKVHSPLRVETQLVGLDRKKVQVFSTIYHAREQFVAATGETLMLHYNQKLGQVIEMEMEIFSRFSNMAEAHSGLPLPAGLGRSVRRVNPAT